MGTTHEVAKRVVGGRWLVDAWVYEHAPDGYFVLGTITRVDGGRGGVNRKVEHRRTLAEAKKRAKEWFEKASVGVEKSMAR